MSEPKQSNAATLLELAHEAVRLADLDYATHASLETVMVCVVARQFEARVAIRVQQIANRGGSAHTPVPKLAPRPSVAPTRRWFTRRL
jgi:hypothetical protein